MRVLPLLALVGLLVVPVVAAADACDPIHCWTDNGTWTPTVGEYIEFTEAPGVVEDGPTCSQRTMDNQYDNCGVPTTCSSGSLATVTVLSEDSSLNGKRVEVLSVGENCFVICAVCGS